MGLVLLLDALQGNRRGTGRAASYFFKKTEKSLLRLAEGVKVADEDHGRRFRPGYEAALRGYLHAGGEGPFEGSLVSADGASLCAF
jgi:hypothetical protein